MSQFFNRIGTYAVKYEFEFEIQSVKLALDQSVNIVIILKRGLFDLNSPILGNHSVQTIRKTMLNT